MDSLPTFFDSLVIGTGFTESLLAASLSRSGQSVLQIDETDVFGESSTALTIPQVTEWINQEQGKGESSLFFNLNSSFWESHSQYSDLHQKQSRFLLDLNPKLLQGNGPFHKFIVQSSILSYLEFGRVDSVLLLQSTPGQSPSFLPFPHTKGEIMNAPFSMAERYAFAPFIHHLEHWDTEDEHPSFMGGMENDLFGSFLQKNRLDTPLMHSLTELCLTMSPSPLNLRTYEALKHIKQYLMSVTVFPVSPITNTPTAFALCHYGTAEITQSLIRTVAVWGGIAMMKTRAVGFIRSVPDHRNWTKNVMGVNIVMNKDEWAIERARRDGLDISAEDKKQIWVKNVIASRSSFDSIIRQTQIPVPTIQAPKRCIQRAILITNQSLYTISSSQSTLSDITSDTLPVDGLVISVPPSFFAPAQASQPSHPQRRQRGASAAQTAATTTANNILTNPVYMIQAQFDRKVSIFAPAPYYVVQMWCVVDQPDLIHTPSSTLFAPLVNHLFSTQSQPDETKPAVLWSLYFSQKLLDGQLFNYSQESITEQSLELFSSSGEVPDLTSCEEQEHPQIPFHIPQESESPLFLVLPSAAPTLLFDSTPSLSHLLDGLTDPIGSSAILTKLVSSQSFGGLSELSIAQIVDLIVRQKCDVLLEKLRAIPRQDFAVVPFIHPITKEEEEERDRLMEEASARQRLKDEADEAASTQVTSTEEAQPEMLTAVEEDNHDRQTTMPSESLTGEAADEPKE